ncbi:22009_t:CDS:1 [Entrophospora sp. SA101]|nr:22009_t:CDS:1 [Entrophospora sp. SA101]
MTVRLKICEELQTFAINLFAQNPQILFDSNKHLYMEDDVLFVGLLKHEDFLMDEIEIWEFMIDWAKSNNDLSKKDIKDWSTEDFQRVSKSMENILPLIRFNNILANEFYEKVQPYRSIFTNHAFYENILWNYILPQKKINSSLTVPSSISTSATLRKGAIDSKILKVKHVALISSWLDQRHVIYYNSQIPYKFALKCRGSEDGFAAEIFRLKSGTIPNTLLIIKVSGTNEILGGYNPTHWGHDRSIKDKSFWRPANNSFIFSMDTDPNKWDSARLSRINPDFSEKAFLISNYSGPQFGNGDLKLGDHFNFKTSSCKKSYYLESIRNTDDNFFSIEEYELFQLVKGV